MLFVLFAYAHMCMARYRKLRDAGVQTQARIVVGTAHAAELFFMMPEVTRVRARNNSRCFWINLDRRFLL